MEKDDINKTHSSSKASLTWKKIKKVLLSNEKLVFLSKLPSIDLNLYQREFKDDQITYNKINQLLTDKYKISLKKSISLKKPIEGISKKDLFEFYNQKIDNTGSIDLWPAEELMSIYCLSRLEFFKGKKVIELGAGFSGLTGLLISDFASEVIITDGNKMCVEALKRGIEFNQITNTQAEVLIWDKNINYKGEYDIVLIADCLFFSKYHYDLADNIYKLLTENGQCWIFSPPRGKTMDNFLKISEEIGLTLLRKETTTVEEIVNTVKTEISEDYLCWFIILSKTKLQSNEFISQIKVES